MLQVDTKANPPRAIWTHPYEDEQFLNEHPDIKKRLAKESSDMSGEAPPPYEPRRHSFSGMPTAGPSRPSARLPTASQSGTPTAGSSTERHKRGFFGKLKDKAIGTKEEREEAKRQQALVCYTHRFKKACSLPNPPFSQLMEQRAEQRRKYLEELRRQQRMAQPARSDYYGQQQYGQQQYGQQQYGYSQPVYGAPIGSPYGYGRPIGSRQRYNNNSGFGGGGIALPLIGGLAGGLLLGDLLDGGFGGPGFF